MDRWVVKGVSGRSRIGICRAVHRSEAPGSGAFWPLGRVPAKGGCRLGESNRNYRDVVLLGGTG